MAMMLYLGGFVFSMQTADYQSFQRSTAWRWESLDRIGRAPALQFAGKGEDSITLPGVLYPELALARGTLPPLGVLANVVNAARSPLAQVPLMREVADKGLPLLMIDSDGKHMGYWVIENVTETLTALFNNGKPRKIVFSLTLKFYGADARQ